MTTTTFSGLGLNDELLKALATEGYTKPTPIQARAIPDLIKGRDLLGIAQTGTGKTAAFALPIMHRLAASARPTPRRGARALVLSPTRELASQIAESFKTYGRHTGFTVATVFGGVAHRPQALALQRGLDVLVATPGRLLDHIQERNIDLSQTEILVLDEADQMMDLGFIRPLRQIISKLSMKRQSMFFSATMPREIGALAAELLRDPVEVSVTPVAKTADRVAQKVIHVEQSKKKSMLVELFGDAAMTRTLVFTRTKRGADKVARHLETHGIAVSAIHGNKSQNQREAALAAFKAGKIRGLIATDIAARGIDVDEVSHVVNFEIPNIPESYVHRIGRTARAGAEGIAISLVDGEERAYLRDIEKLTRQQIPSQDRRNDASLAVEERGPRQPRGEHGHGERSHRDAGRGRSERGGRFEGRDANRRGGPGRTSERSAPAHGRKDDNGAEPRSETRGEARPDRKFTPRSGGKPFGGSRSEGSRSEGSRSEGARTEGKRFEPRARDERGASGRGRDDAHRPSAPRSHDRPQDRDRGHGGKPQHASRDHVHEQPFGAVPQRPDGAVKRDFDGEGDRRPAQSNGHRTGRSGPGHQGGQQANNGQHGPRGRAQNGSGNGSGQRQRDGEQRRASSGQGRSGGEGGWARRPR